jgi:hypothetical protein
MKYFISLKDQDGEWVDTRTIRESPFLKPGSSTRFDIEANIGVMLAGDVLGANSGMPIKASVNIVVFDAETGEPAGTGFSMDGASSYKMRLPGSGSYLLGATYLFFLEHDEQMAFFASGNDDKAPVRVEVGVGGTRADVTVPEPFALPVRVVTADGDPVESASLNLSRMHPGYVGDRGALSTPRRANREGRYTWYAMPGREVWISATNPGFSIARTPHFVGEPGEVSPEIELILRKPGDIFGQIVTPDGKLITSGDLNISVSNGQGQRILGTDFTVDDGIFFLPGILKDDRILVTIMYNHREIWTEPYVHEGPADVDLDFGDITVWPEP